MRYGTIEACGQVRFLDDGKNHYVALDSPSVLLNDYTLVLPDNLPGSTRYLTVDATGQMAYANAVTSVGLEMPGIFTVTNNVVTDSGNLSVSLANANQNTVFAGPTAGGAGEPSFRGLVTGDFTLLPSLNEWAPPVSSLDLNNQTISNLADPVNPQDAATKSFVEATVQGISPLISARYSTISNIPNILSANAATVQASLDSVDSLAPTLEIGDRVVVKSQTNLAENGVYTWNGASLERSEDADSDLEIGPGSYIFVQQGDVYGDTGWLVSSDEPFTLGTSDLTWIQFSSAGQIQAGDSLEKVGNVLSVKTIDPSRIVVNPDGLDLATTGAVAGTYNSVTVDTYGRVSSGTSEPYAKSFEQTFVNGDLTSGLITITHNLGKQYPSFSLSDGSDLRIQPDQFLSVNANSVQIDLTSFAPLTGTYKVSLYA